MRSKTVKGFKLQLDDHRQNFESFARNTKFEKARARLRGASRFK